MTPEQRAATFTTTFVPKGWLAFENAGATFEAFAEALRTARSEALEEAAKISDAHVLAQYEDCGMRNAEFIASAIRALKNENG